MSDIKDNDLSKQLYNAIAEKEMAMASLEIVQNELSELDELIINHNELYHERNK